MKTMLNKLRGVKQRLLNQHPVYSKEPWRDPGQRQRISREFRGLYYDAFREGLTWADTWFLGVKVEKCPLDLWLYQEIISTLRPDLIVETGTRFGGSALYCASICELLGKGEVVSIDIDDSVTRPAHARVTYLSGSSTDPNIVNQVRNRAAGKNCVMVLLDSDHYRDHVYAELEAYSEFVTRDSFMIVEDSNVNGHPVLANFGPGPMEAIEEFLESDNRFVSDPIENKFLFSFSPNGFLRRVD